MNYTYRWFRIIITFLASISGMALAAEPPYTYKDFGYSPPNTEFGELREEQRAALESCILFANERESSSRKNAELMASIYGGQARQYDHFGVYITACLADEKGWSVHQKSANGWQAVKSRYAARSFMQLDPNQ